MQNLGGPHHVVGTDGGAVARLTFDRLELSPAGGVGTIELPYERPRRCCSQPAAMVFVDLTN